MDWGIMGIAKKLVLYVGGVAALLGIFFLLFFTFQVHLIIDCIKDHHYQWEQARIRDELQIRGELEKEVVSQAFRGMLGDLKSLSDLLLNDPELTPEILQNNLTRILTKNSSASAVVLKIRQRILKQAFTPGGADFEICWQQREDGTFIQVRAEELLEHYNAEELLTDLIPYSRVKLIPTRDDTGQNAALLLLPVRQIKGKRIGGFVGLVLPVPQLTELLVSRLIRKEPEASCVALVSKQGKDLAISDDQCPCHLDFGALKDRQWQEMLKTVDSEKTGIFTFAAKHQADQGTDYFLTFNQLKVISECQDNWFLERCYFYPLEQEGEFFSQLVRQNANRLLITLWIVAIPVLLLNT